MNIKCAHCGKMSDKPPGAVNRAREIGAALYCDRKCAGRAKRKHKTRAQKKEEKRLYDIEYRARNLERILARKHDYHKRTYDPAKARVERKKRAKWHAEYCRRPEYKRWKSNYDRKRRDAIYGPFAEAARLTIDLNRAIKERATNEQIKWQNGTANKTIRREREARQPERSRPRYRDRRDRHQAALG